MADEEVIVEDGESEYEPVTANGQEERQAIDSWSFYDILQVNPWLLAILAFAAYYVYQNYLSKLKFSSDEARITQNDENRMQQMMEVRNRQQRMYTEASLGKCKSVLQRSRNKITKEVLRFSNEFDSFIELACKEGLTNKCNFLQLYINLPWNILP